MDHFGHVSGPQSSPPTRGFPTTFCPIFILNMYSPTSNSSLLTKSETIHSLYRERKKKRSLAVGRREILVIFLLTNGDMEDQKSLPESLGQPTGLEELGKSGKKDMFVVEKASTDGLPPGWIKETRVRKLGRKIRKDPYYTDPVSGYVFRSLKDIHRYLQTGELGRLAFKPKDKDRINVELDNDKLASPAVAEVEIATESGTNIHIIGSQSLKLADTAKNEPILQSTCTADQCKEVAAASSVHPQEATDIEQNEGKSEQINRMLVSDRLTVSSLEKLPLENGVEKEASIQSGMKKQQEKRKSELPRRASKRLAGIELDSAREPKTNNRTCELTPIQSGEPETSPEITSVKNFTDLTNHEGHTEKEETENVTHERQEHAGQVEIDNMADVKPDSPLNLSLIDLWTDPCIEFAVKTLTGAIPIGDEINDNKVDENLESSIDYSLEELWTDPCIEFAVKTLTGAIPVVEDLGIQDYSQHNVSSSQTLEENSFSWSNSSLDNFCQTDLVSKYFNTAAEKPPLYEKRDQMAAGNVSLHNTGASGLYQYAEGRSEECSRPTVI